MSAKETKAIVHHWFRVRLTMLVAIGISFIVGVWLVSGLAQDQPQERKSEGEHFPDLVGGLKATPGCLGVETARTDSGKNVIFAGFEDKDAVLRWYYSDMHQGVMHTFAPDRSHREPLEGVPDDIGPIMAIASISMADQPHFKDVSLPVSQISIELYTPITGGLFFGGRFAPDSLKVPRMQDYTPKEK